MKLIELTEDLHIPGIPISLLPNGSTPLFCRHMYTNNEVIAVYLYNFIDSNEIIGTVLDIQFTYPDNDDTNEEDIITESYKKFFSKTDTGIAIEFTNMIAQRIDEGLHSIESLIACNMQNVEVVIQRIKCNGTVERLVDTYRLGKW